MPTRELLAPSQRAHFTDFTAPLDDRTLARFYTLSDKDLELICRRHRRASTQLGFAVQLGYARAFRSGAARRLRSSSTDRGHARHSNWVSTLRSLPPTCMAVTRRAASTCSNYSATSASVRFQPRSTESWPVGCCRSPSAPTSGRSWWAPSLGLTRFDGHLKTGDTCPGGVRLMEKRSRRKFTKEVKAETVVLIRRSGKSIAELCREMGLPESSVHRWLAQADIDSGQRDGLTTAEREELSRLRRELRVVREERDVLAKAIAFFTKETTRRAAIGSLWRRRRNTRSSCCAACWAWPRVRSTPGSTNSSPSVLKQISGSAT
jgi:transposase